MIITIVFLSNMFCVRKRNISTSQGDISFTHPKHMLLKTVIKIDHEYVLIFVSSASLNSFRISEYFEKSKFEFLKFLCIYFYIDFTYMRYISISN